MKGTIQSWNENENNDNYSIELENNIELRDYFAGQALNSEILVYNTVLQTGVQINCKEIADICYSLADAMLKRRETK